MGVPTECSFDLLYVPFRSRTYRVFAAAGSLLEGEGHKSSTQAGVVREGQ